MGWPLDVRAMTYIYMDLTSPMRTTINSSINDQMSRISTCVQSYGHFDHQFTYYAGIMLTALRGVLCSKQCWHNVLVPHTVAIVKSSINYCTCPI